MREHITGYLAGTLPPKQRDRVEAHLRECTACAEEVALLRRAKALFPALPPKPLPADFTARVMSRVAVLPQQEATALPHPTLWWRPFVLPAGALAAAAIMLVILHLAPMHEQQQMAQKPTTPTNPPVTVTQPKSESHQSSVHKPETPNVRIPVPSVHPAHRRQIITPEKSTVRKEQPTQNPQSVHVKETPVLIAAVPDGGNSQKSNTTDPSQLPDVERTVPKTETANRQSHVFGQMPHVYRSHGSFCQTAGIHPNNSPSSSHFGQPSIHHVQSDNNNSSSGEHHAKLPSTFTITPSADTNGRIVPDAIQSVKSGSDIKFTAIAKLGYTVDTWKVDGADMHVNDTSFTLRDITLDHSVSVTFKSVQ